jgi:hypothetical protein
MRRALIGIDGNCGFAGIGHLAESPDWEFVEIVGDPKDPDAQRGAAAQALQRLREKLAPEHITYALDGSHPRAR